MKLSRALPLLPLLPLAVTLNGCMNVGPNYSLPKQALINAPLANAPIEGADAKLTSRQNVPAVWWKLYDDPVLNSLVD
ncbi:MAG TPA: TolC family protein, partial [Paraburkholderia sp.]|nr:TolC family protein [Paraburkholderia sp.]